MSTLKTKVYNQDNVYINTFNDINKVKALATFLDTSIDNISENGSEYEHGNQSYLVLSDDEATMQCREYIQTMLWAFNTSYIMKYIDFSDDDDNEYNRRDVEQSIQEMQKTQCEGCNLIIKKLVANNLDRFIDDAIEVDGQGHFLASYDSNENIETINSTDYYIYRTN